MSKKLTDGEREARKQYGQRLLLELKRRNLSQAEFCQMMVQKGWIMSPQKLSKIIKGKRSMPYYMAQSIARFWPESAHWNSMPAEHLYTRQFSVLGHELNLPSNAEMKFRECIMTQLKEFVATGSLIGRARDFKHPCPRLIRQCPTKEDGTTNDNTWIGRVTQQIRKSWGLGDVAPIASIEHTLEENGIMIFRFSEEIMSHARLGAVSLEISNYAILAISTRYGDNGKSRAERRFEVCRALMVGLAGKVGAHERCLTQNRNYAVMLAAAFLLPTQSIHRTLKNTHGKLWYHNHVTGQAVLAMESRYGLPRQFVINRLVAAEVIDRKRAHYLEKEIQGKEEIKDGESSCWRAIATFP
ncbi:helix-turn-helix domain-containing protein [Ereboglobus luteus]|uniref:Uncharacterized protein n=1 Tax=Ereboglobus luteus TaxID=1796921 RepID=A0A2U8E1J1_9BACT|nr:helix-turn-helix transcriptional regulator [Ereboglobus luteus]AWI08733.1 hypothetical protein CKA38_05215 [Ereboglobus luteus]